MLGFRDSGTAQFNGPEKGTSTEPGLLYRACWGLALLTEVYRRGPAVAAAGPISHLPDSSARSLLAAAPEAGLEQLAAPRASTSLCSTTESAVILTTTSAWRSSATSAAMPP